MDTNLIMRTRRELQVRFKPICATRDRKRSLYPEPIIALQYNLSAAAQLPIYESQCSTEGPSQLHAINLLLQSYFSLIPELIS